MFRGISFQADEYYNHYSKNKAVFVMYGFLFNECCSYFVEIMHIARRTCMTLLLCCMQDLWIPRLASHS
ncbi:hypothetical protein OIU77_001158, partial [Salix suchowensis]